MGTFAYICPKSAFEGNCKKNAKGLLVQASRLRTAVKGLVSGSGGCEMEISEGYKAGLSECVNIAR